MALQVGYLGVFVFFPFLMKIEKVALFCFEHDETSYWRAFGLGMAGFSFIMIYVALIYSPAYIDDCLSAFYFSLAAVLYTRVRDVTAMEGDAEERMLTSGEWSRDGSPVMDGVVHEGDMPTYEDLQVGE
jgi:hypothetical protein